MPEVAITDAINITDRKMTGDGYMVVDARFARTGIQEYSGRELGRPELGIVRVYRPESSVFDAAAMASFAHKPITNGHPASGEVTSRNYTQVAKGHSGDVVTRDGEFVRVPMMVTDAAAVADIEAGICQLSAGYRAKIEFTAGVMADGTPYDAIMGPPKGNHIAYLPRGRAGNECRIGDSWTETKPKEIVTMELEKIIVDGITIEVTKQGAEAVAKLTKQLNDAKTAETTAVGALAAAQAAHAGVVAAKDTEIATLKDAVPDAAKLEAMAVGREAVISDAKRILGDKFDFKGKSEADIKKAAVLHKLGDKFLDGKPVEHVGIIVDSAYDTLLSAAVSKSGTDPLRRALANPSKVVTDTGSSLDAYNESLTELRDAWKTPSGKAA